MDVYKVAAERAIHEGLNLEEVQRLSALASPHQDDLPAPLRSLWRQSIGKRKRGWRVVLLHEEGFQEAQRSARVRQVLAASGLSEEAAQFVLVAAHRTGRSVVRYTQLEEDAQKEAAFLSLYKLKVLVEPVQYWAP